MVVGGKVASLYKYSFSKLIVNIVSCVLDGDDTSALEMTHYGDLFTAVATKGEQEIVELLVVGFDASYDVFYSVLSFSEIHQKHILSKTLFCRFLRVSPC